MNAKAKANANANAKRGPREKVLRFTVTERLYHWAQALPFLVLLASGGLILAQRLAGAEWVGHATLARVHKVAGVSLPAAIFLVFLGGDRRTLLRNLRPGCPKFNGGQKVNLYAQVVLIPVLVASGSIMWLIHGALLPWYVHVAAFAVACPLIAGHLFMAVINPATRKGLAGVFTGRVDAEWAREHYPGAYGPSAAPSPAPEPRPARERGPEPEPVPVPEPAGEVVEAA